jgi:uncharacterized protein YdeI (YjbR/CyaY-like superfamily)
LDPIFFTTPTELREWFSRNHETATELIVGFHRKATGRPTLTWPQAVDEALCVGWIDGICRRIDETSYTNRFTPRKPQSNWSAVNIRRVHELTAEGRMQPAGLAAFERRTEARSAVYAYEQRHLARLDAAEQAMLDANDAARTFWASQPAGYRTTATYWVVTAKRPETRARRLAQLIEDSAAGRRLRQLTPDRR